MARHKIPNHYVTQKYFLFMFFMALVSIQEIIKFLIARRKTFWNSLVARAFSVIDVYMGGQTKVIKFRFILICFTQSGCSFNEF